MIKRTCPKCGKAWYSAAAQHHWSCQCGMMLDPQTNQLAEQSGHNEKAAPERQFQKAANKKLL